MSSIQFTDAIGAATLQSAVPAPGNRFANWTPDRDDINARDVAFGTGDSFSFDFRTDYTAAFDIPYLAQSKLAVAMRLKAWLIAGGQVTVNTADKDAATYTAKIKPGTTPTIVLADRNLMEYTMHVELKNASAAPMTVNYGAVS
jgi:hypothetical protein